MEALVGAIIAALVSKIAEFLTECQKKKPEEQSELQNLPRHVSSMQYDLQYFRDSIKEAHRSDMLTPKAWLSELTCFVNQFEDSIDLYQYAKTKDDRESLAQEVEAIKNRLLQVQNDLLKRCSEATTSNPAQGQKGRPDHSQSTTKKDLNDQSMVGMDEALNELKKVLLKSNSKMNLKVICIVGFGGIGKTFLAKKLCKSVQNDFPLQAWVSASGKEDAEAIINEIEVQLRKLDEIKGVDDETISNKIAELEINNVNDSNGGKTSNESPQIKNASMEEETPQAKNSVVKSNHCKKRILVVIDDVQKRELLNRDGIIEGLPPGSRIIVTTTRQSVANNIRPGDHVYRMKTLDGAYPEQLFSQVACTENYSEAQKDATRSVIDICDGLPLALVSTAQFLKHEVPVYRMEERKIKEKCKEALKDCRTCASSSPGSEEKLRRMKRVLLDNYHNLDGVVIKDCLLYLCMFPRGHPVKTSSLARRWMAEGLVQERYGVDVAEVADENINILIDRNIIQPIDEDVKTCQLPVAIMLEYISHQSKTEGFMRRANLSSPQDGMPNQAEYVRRLSIHNYDDSFTPLPSKKIPYLRTLAMFREGAKPVAFKADLADYKLLRVLDLEECNGLQNSHLEDICNSKPPLLKYLSLGGSITSVPRTIAGLKALQTLDLRRCSPDETEVPIEVFYMLPELKHLFGMFFLLHDDLSKKEKKVKETCQLETLAGFVVSNSRGKNLLGRNRSDMSRLMICMERLRKVKIRCQSSAKKHHLRAIEKFILNVHNTPDNRSLSIHLTEGCSTLDLLEENTGIISLYSLKLHGKLSKFPPFVSKVSGITKLCLRSTGLEGGHIISSIKGLTTLTHLKLVEERLVKLAIGEDCLQSLERICLVSKKGNMPDIEIHNEAMKSIISISLHLLPGPSSDNNIEDRITSWKEAAKKHPNMPNLFIKNT